MIYLDNAATTKLDPRVLEEMMPFLTSTYANPSSSYNFGTRVRNAIFEAREIVASSISVSPEEIYFTSGATEGNNFIITNAYFSELSKKNLKQGHIITTKIEHPSVIEPVRRLEKLGARVSYLPVDSRGVVSIDSLKNEIHSDTVLISIIYANNEIGTIEPIEELSAIANEKNIFFHTDSVQAYAHLKINAKLLGISSITATAHKINGPKGAGFVYINKAKNISPFIIGGKQEAGMRAGTENVYGIVGLGAAAKFLAIEFDDRIKKELSLRNRLMDRLLSEISDSHLNGDREIRLSNNVNISFSGVSAEALLISLDFENILISAGTTCSSGSLVDSPVLTAIGLDKSLIKNTIRITPSYENTEQQIDIAIDRIKGSIERIRNTL